MTVASGLYCRLCTYIAGPDTILMYREYSTHIAEQFLLTVPLVVEKPVLEHLRTFVSSSSRAVFLLREL